MKPKVLILGISGMLGSSMFRAFRASASFEVIGTVRSSSALQHFSDHDARAIVAGIDILDADLLEAAVRQQRPNFVINCVGLIKQFAASNDPLVALPLNAMFPHRLARLCAPLGVRVIHISTDCVFSGRAGQYTETDIPDADDLYGISKALGELHDYRNAVTLRTSIIGRELNTAHSLVDWFLAQQGEVRGYRQAIFSGLPTSELANVVRDIVIPNAELFGLYHVSATPISKYDLLHLIARQYGKDIRIDPDDRVRIDRSLNSSRFTRATKYHPPGWPELVRRMYENDHRRGAGNV
jgi:dTDP-4-dehydrorhamnose reductase